MVHEDQSIASLKPSLFASEQEHLLHWWNELTEEQQNKLQKDISSINFKQQLSDFHECMLKDSSKSQKEDELKPLPAESYESVFNSNDDNERWTKLGLKEISDGKVALLLLAGGQGTRLGVSYPKGMYDVGLLSGKCLYQLQAERIHRQENWAHEVYGTSKPIQWYIMTSDHTRGATLDYFKKHNWFGLSEKNVTLFEQEMVPCISNGGKIIMSSKYSISRAPGGNGDLYRALGQNMIVDDMVNKGIKSVHVYCVDNILVKIPDPLFIGCCVERESDCGAKVVSKSHPTEAVGVICICNGKIKVVEYSEISSETANLRDASGKLLFSQGNICNHYFSTAFLKDIVENHATDLAFHIAKKKIPTIDSNGNAIIPTTPNGIKMERFVFDVFEFSEKFTALEVSRSEEFSPLKNGPGAEKCCPGTCRTDLSNLHKRWIIEAGGIINGKGICEVSPLLSSTGENLESRVSGQAFNLPLYLDDQSNGNVNGYHSKL